MEEARRAPVQNNQKLAFDDNCLERLNGRGSDSEIKSHGITVMYTPTNVAHESHGAIKQSTLEGINHDELQVSGSGRLSIELICLLLSFSKKVISFKSNQDFFEGEVHLPSIIAYEKSSVGEQPFWKKCFSPARHDFDQALHYINQHSAFYGKSEILR